MAFLAAVEVFSGTHSRLFVVYLGALGVFGGALAYSWDHWVRPVRIYRKLLNCQLPLNML